MTSRTLVSTGCTPLCQIALVFPFPGERFSWIQKRTSGGAGPADLSRQAVSWYGDDGDAFPWLCPVFSCSSLLGVKPGNCLLRTHFIGVQNVLTPSPPLACFVISLSILSPRMLHKFQDLNKNQDCELLSVLEVRFCEIFALGSRLSWQRMTLVHIHYWLWILGKAHGAASLMLTVF